MNKLFPILFIVLFAGCIEIKVSTPEKNEEPAPAVVGDSKLSPELQKVKIAFDSIQDVNDKLTIHKLFAGSADYLAVCEELETTAQFDPILGKVQSSYGWDREKYPALTDAVSEYLISVKYQEPKSLKTDQDRKAFAKIFQDLSEATKYE